MFDFCLPTRSTTFPQTDDWLHEIKYEDYHLRLECDNYRVRLIVRGALGSVTVDLDAKKRQ